MKYLQIDEKGTKMDQDIQQWKKEYFETKQKMFENNIFYICQFYAVSLHKFIDFHKYFHKFIDFAVG